MIDEYKIDDSINTTIILPTYEQLWDIEKKYCGDSCIGTAMGDVVNLIIRINNNIAKGE